MGGEGGEFRRLDGGRVDKGARYEPALSEFILPYDAVRDAPDPEAAMLEFFETTYTAAADLGKWDRRSLER